MLSEHRSLTGQFGQMLVLAQAVLQLENQLNCPLRISFAWVNLQMVKSKLSSSCINQSGVKSISKITLSEAFLQTTLSLPSEQVPCCIMM